MLKKMLRRLAAVLLLGCTGSYGVVAAAGDETGIEFRVFTGSEPALFPNSVLIMGRKQAVLVDGQWWLSEGMRLADMIAASGRELTTILVTHAHPDHYSGLNPVLERFPNAKVLARKPVRDVIAYEYPAKLMHWQAAARNSSTRRSITCASTWRSRDPGSGSSRLRAR